MSEKADLLSNLTDEQRAALIRRLMAKKAAPGKAQAIPRRRTRSPCPLSAGQELMWVLDQLTPGNNAYNAPGVRRIKGDLNLQASRQALDALVARHEILRTTYSAVDGIPVQIIHDKRSVDLPVIDLRHLPGEEREAKAHQIIVEEAQRPFDLSRDLMLRTLLVQVADDEYLLLFAQHHIATDGWSKEVMYRELGVLYEAFSTGKIPNIPDLPIQYGDFAVWQRQWLKSEAFEKHLAFWKKRLAGAPPLLEVPADHPRPAIQTSNGRHRRFPVPRSVHEGLKVLGQQQGVTPFIILLAGFQTLLHRYTGQEDVVVGSPIANRNHRDLEGLVGYFSNTLAMRTNFSGDPTFRELLLRVRETALTAYDHQDMPFEKLVVELKPNRDLSYTPVVQVAFIVHTQALGEKMQLPGVTLTPVQINRGTTKFDLTMSFILQKDGLQGSSEYSTDLFEETTIARLQENFMTLMEAAVADPDQQVSKLPLLMPDQRRQLVVDWNRTESDFRRDVTVQHLFEAQVKQAPDAIAVEHEGQHLTYRELNERANRLAHYLKRQAVGPETRVAICMERSPEMIVGLLGILKAGGAHVPLDPNSARQRLHFMVRDAEARLVLTQKQLVNQFADASVPCLCQDTEWDTLALESSENPAVETTANSLAYVIYTSGSTGTPKGVMVEHGSLVNAYLAWEEAYGLPAQATAHLQMANFVFDVFTGDLVRALCSGGKLVLCPMETMLTPDKLYALMRREKIDCAEFVPAVLRILVAYLEETKQTLDFMRLLIAGSDSWYAGEYKSILRFCGPNTRLINSYGVAEATIDSTYFETRVMELPADKLVSIGRPFPNTRIYIVDSHLQALPIGVPGELYIGGRGLARGYLSRPDLTAEKFLPDPFHQEPGARIYKTGDRARYLAHGNIEFLGRTDNQVKIRGLRIELGEIEAVLSQHPTVRDTAVLAREDQPGSKHLIAYIVFDGPAKVPVAELRAFVKEKLPDYMVPSAFHFLDQMPLTPNGKVDRQALPLPDLATLTQEGYQVAPRTGLELELAMIWEEVLALQSVGIHDNFFELGGNSMSAVRMLALIEKTFGQKLPLVTLFQAPTIEQLAALLQKDDAGRSLPTLMPIKPGGTQFTLFGVAIPRANPLGYAFLARHLEDDQPLYVLQSQYMSPEEAERLHTDCQRLAARYVQEMRSRQPQGPYYLIGQCLGAHIAFEMATQLEAQGEKVAFLGILDTEATNTLSHFWYLRRAHTRSRYYWRRLGALLRAPVAEGSSLLSRKTKAFFARLSRVLSAFGTAKDLNPPRAKPARFLQPSSVTYHGRITLFRVQKQQYWRKRDLYKGWGKRTTAGIDVHILPGDHLTMWREPHVQDLARALTSSLAKAVAAPAENGVVAKVVATLPETIG